MLGHCREFPIRFSECLVPLDRPLALSSEGSTLALDSGFVGFIDMLSGSSRWTSGNENDIILAIQLSPDNSHLVIACMDASSDFRRAVFTNGFLRMLSGNGDIL